MLWNKETSFIPTKEKDGYLGTMALPRLLTVKDGKLWQKTLPSLEKYLKAGQCEDLGPGQRKEYSLASHLRIEGCNEPLSLSFFLNSHGGVHLAYDPLKKEAVITIEDDRRESFLIYDGEERTVELQDGLWSIDAYLDRYVLELCFNGGEKWASLMYYPHLSEGRTSAVEVKSGHPSIRENVFEKASK